MTLGERSHRACSVPEGYRSTRHTPSYAIFRNNFAQGQAGKFTRSQILIGWAELTSGRHCQLGAACGSMSGGRGGPALGEIFLSSVGQRLRNGKRPSYGCISVVTMPELVAKTSLLC